MKKYRFLYPAIFIKDEDGHYQAIFPDLDIYCNGDNLSEAYLYAKDLLRVYFTYALKYETEYAKPTQLEKIIHPAIKEKISEFFEKNKSESLVFVGIPLLFESDMRNIFDIALLIYTDDEIRLQRLLSRNHYPTDYAKQRMQSQLSQDTKLNLCEYVIYNNGTISELEKSVNDFLLNF